MKFEMGKKTKIICTNCGTSWEGLHACGNPRPSVEQSKEEQCHDSCHLNGQPVHCQSCEPKTESISIEKGRELVKKIQAKTEKQGDLLSNCCAWDFDPFGVEKDEGVYQERCLKCGKLCEPLYIGKNDILNIRRLTELEPKTEDTGECNCIDSFDSATGEDCPHSFNLINSAPLNKEWKLRNKIKQIVDEYHRIQTKKGGLDLDGWIDSIMDDVSQEISWAVTREHMSMLEKHTKEIESARASERKALIEEVRKSLDGASLIDDPTLLVKIDIEEKLDELLSKIEK